MKKFGNKFREAGIDELMKIVDHGILQANKQAMTYNKKYGLPLNTGIKETFDKSLMTMTTNDYLEKPNIFRRYGKLNKSLFKTSSQSLIPMVEEQQSPTQVVPKKFEPLVTSAEQLPSMKTEVVYKHDTVQILESLKTLSFKPENRQRFIDMLGVIRKKKDLKIYDFPEITNILSYLQNDLATIPTSYKVSLLYSLSKLQLFNTTKPSLENKNFVYELLNHISGEIKKLDIRGTANFVYALHTFQMRNAHVYNFNDFLTKIEVDIIDKFVRNKSAIDTQSLSNVVLAYCKTQNGSEEFYRILQELIYEKCESLTYQDLAVIIYSYANNPNCNEKILILLEDRVKRGCHKFKTKELCSIMRGYDLKGILTPKLRNLITENFVQKHELTNALDLAYFYTTLNDDRFKLENTELYKRFITYIHSCIDGLMFTFTGTEIAILSKKANVIQGSNVELFGKFQKQVLKLIRQNEFKGFDLKQVYLNTRYLPFEGKYNLFNEAVEKHLEKLKYY
jgi:hypothetical protein